MTVGLMTVGQKLRHRELCGLEGSGGSGGIVYQDQSQKKKGKAPPSVIKRVKILIISK